MIILFVFNLLLLLLYNINLTKQNRNIKKKKLKSQKIEERFEEKESFPCPSSCLYIYSPSICIYTREMTPNVYLVVLFFFCFPLTLNNYSLASSIFLKYSQMGSSTFARAAAVFTRICICVCVCVYIYMCVY